MGSQSPSFYDDQVKSRNPFRAWWHNKRHETIRTLVHRYYRGGIIVDLGCANVLWNAVNRLPVIGIDRDKVKLQYALERGRLSVYKAASIETNGLISGIADVVICSEVLEHSHDGILLEIKRLLTKDGHAIITMPYDTILSLWRPLFAIQCFWQGYIKGDEYYKDKCGHIRHFSPSTAKWAIENNGGMRVIKQFDIARMTIVNIAVREDYKSATS